MNIDSFLAPLQNLSFKASMKTMLLLLTLLLHLVHSQNVQFTPNSPETLVNMILSDSKLLLGTSRAVYRTDLVLNLEQRRELLSTNRLLVADRPTGTLNGTVMTCDEDSCYLLETVNLDNTKWQVPREKVLQMNGGVARGSFNIGPNGTSDITYGEPAGSVSGRRFVKAALRNVMSTNPADFIHYASRSDSNANDEFDFIKDTFTFSNYTYFTLQPTNSEIRLVRFCQRDPGFVFGTRRFSSIFEIKLSCRTNTNRDIESSSATFKETPQGPVIFLAVNTLANSGVVRREVCSFSLDTINQLMTDKITECVMGFGIPRPSSQLGCPTHFSEAVRQQIITVSYISVIYNYLLCVKPCSE